MAQYKANEKYFKLGEKKDFRAIGGYSKHGLLVAGHSIDLDEIPKGMKDCFDAVESKSKKIKKNKEKK